MEEKVEQINFIHYYMGYIEKDFYHFEGEVSKQVIKLFINFSCIREASHKIIGVNLGQQILFGVVMMSTVVYCRLKVFLNLVLKVFLNLVFLERGSIVMYLHSKLFLNLVFNFHSKLFLNFVISTLIAIYFRLKLFLNFE